MAIVKNVDTTQVYTDKRFRLGDITFDSSGNEYMFCQIYASSANAASAGRWFWHTATKFVVSDDIDQVNVNNPAGLAIATCAKSSYCWIMRQGNYTTAKKLVSTGVTIAINSFLVPGNSSQDGTVKRMGATALVIPTQYAMGIALAAATGLATTISVRVTCSK